MLKSEPKCHFHLIQRPTQNSCPTQISNAQTKEEYIEDDCLIPKNTSLTVARVPLSSSQYKKWEQQQQQQTSAPIVHNEQPNNIPSSANMDLSKMNGSEEDKIQAMIAQSTLDYDPTK